LGNIENTEFKRILRKYEFLLEDFQDVLQISKEANSGMSSQINKNKPKEINESDFQKEDTDIKEEIGKQNDEDLKKLYRKIVRECHPDKLSYEIDPEKKIKLKDMYNKAVIAKEEQNWALMVMIAVKLDIDLPKEAEYKMQKIKEETEELEKKINNITKSVPWKWFHSDEKTKEEIVNNYIERLFKRKKNEDEK